jgi:hypothetical protein
MGEPAPVITEPLAVFPLCAMAIGLPKFAHLATGPSITGSASLMVHDELAA